MNLLNRIVTVCALLTCLTNVQAQTRFTKNVDQVIAEANKIVNFNGTILIANSERVIYQSSIGFADKEEKTSLTNDHRFAPGSIIKEFTTVALMRLEAKGKINYHDKITKYLTDLPAWANDITIEHLLTHTSGLGEMNYVTGIETADVFEQIKAVKKLKYPPGEGFSYGNFVTVLRALIIENVTNIDYKSFIEKDLFALSKMTTAFARDDIKTTAPLMAFGEKPLAIDGVTAYMTAFDIYKWEKALWTNCLISNKAFKMALLTPSKGGPSRAYFDFGFYSTNKKGEISEVWHDGTYPAHFALKYYDVKKDLFIILLSRDGRKATLKELRPYISTLFTNSTLPTIEQKTASLPLSWWLKEQLKVREYVQVFAELSLGIKNGTFVTNEAELSTYAYNLLSNKKYLAGLELMKITVTHFPSANAYDSYVELLLRAEQYKDAKLAAEQGLALAKKENNSFLLGRLVEFLNIIDTKL
jgi:CubicO group peptidase (beta-lactamase class C family)